jgi:hypothetical protein
MIPLLRDVALMGYIRLWEEVETMSQDDILKPIGAPSTPTGTKRSRRQPLTSEHRSDVLPSPARLYMYTDMA